MSKFQKKGLGILVLLVAVLAGFVLFPEKSQAFVTAGKNKLQPPIVQPPVEYPHGWHKANGQRGGDLLAYTAAFENAEDLALDFKQRPCAVWTKSIGNEKEEVLFSCFDGNFWHGLTTRFGPDNISNSSKASLRPRIAVSAAGKMFIVWSEAKQDIPIPDREIRLVTWTGTEWRGLSGAPYDVVNTGVNAGDGIAIAVNPVTGFPGVLWNTSYQKNLLFREWNGFEYVGYMGNYDSLIEPSDQTDQVVQPSLAYAPNGTPHAVWTNYYATSWADIRYRRFDGTKWRGYVTTGSDNLSNVPQQSEQAAAISVRPNGNPVVAWEESVAPVGNVRYLEWDGTFWKGHINQQPDNVSGLGGGLTPQLSLKSDAQPLLTYWRWDPISSVKQVLVTKWTGSAWTGLDGSDYEVVDIGDPLANLGVGPIVALDDKDKPHLLWTYLTNPNNNVAYSRWK